MFTFQALLARRQALFMLAALAGAGLSRAETEIYKTIDWNDLMPDPWVKEMTKDMAAMSKLSYLQDSSDEATKAMSAIRKKLDEAPIVKTQVNKKVRIPVMPFPWTQNAPTNANFCWCLISVHAYIPRRRPPIKSYWCDQPRKARSKKCPNPWTCCGWKAS